MLILILSSCTVHKDQDDPSFLGKFYHNTTARYNGYFNADLLMKESIAALTQEYTEDYDTLIPVYPYMANPNVENQYSTLDKVIEKVTTVSALHRQSDWLDDNYLLLGKAQFLKKNYKEAGAAFQYLVNNFDPASPNEEAREEDLDRSRERNSRKAYKQRQKEREKRRKEINKKRENDRKKSRQRKGSKKRRERPEETKSPLVEMNEPSEALLASASKTPVPTLSGNLIPAESNPDQFFLKHEPAYQEGLLWQARTWTAQENYFSAEARLSLLIKDPNTSEDIRDQALVALIDSYVKSKKYSRAVETIGEALGQNLEQRTKIRLAFLAGQILAQLNSNQKAIEYFETVIKLHPEEYEKYFFANLFITRLTGGDLIGKFQDLLKDPNNEPYKGQIYYTMGETYRYNYDFERAIESYKKIEDPQLNVNPAIKAKAFIAIADINFDSESFSKAKEYYDKALASLSPEDSRYSRVKELSEKLTNIAAAKETIQYQDSLLMVAGYTDEQKKELALQIKKLQQKEQNQAVSDGSGQSTAIAGNQMVSRIGSAGRVQSTFFAYDEKSLSQGQKSFKKIWGDRKLADNWRYSSSGGAIASGDNASEGRTITLGITQTEIDEILQEVPETPEEKEEVNNKIDEAMLKLGFALRSDLGKLDKSNETLIRLIERKPDREIYAEALYLLFINARETGDNVTATQYKKQFDSQFGDTDFANKILTTTTAIGKDNVAESALEQVRKDYELGNYEKVLQLSDQSKTMFENRTDLLAQFALLEALATGQTKGRDAYIEKLKYLVANFPDSEEGEQAKEYLRILGATVNTNITPQSGSTEDFSDDVDNTPHYILVLVNSSDEINPLKTTISDFNKLYFQNANVSISTVQLSTPEGRVPAILVRRFNNKKEAMDYYQVTQKNKTQFSGDHGVTILPLAITNYRFLITENRLPEYKDFLSQKYGITFN